jgi:hypothetical protein
MIPLFKVVVIFIKTFTKPVVGIMKKMTFNNRSFLRNPLILVGNYLNRIEVRINRRFIGVQNTSTQVIPDLADDKAFENAMNFLLEAVFIYGLLLSIAIFEVIKGMDEKKNMKADMVEMKKTVIELRQQLGEIVEATQQYKAAIEAQQKEQEKLLEGIVNYNGMMKQKSVQNEKYLQEQQEFYKKQLEDLRREVDLAKPKPDGTAGL